MRRVTMQSPARVALRIAIVALAVLWAGQRFDRTLVEWMLPALRASTEFLAYDFKFVGIDVVHDGLGDTLRVQANLTRPIDIAGRTVYPLGWGSRTPGWTLLNFTLGGLLQYAALLLIVVIAWPARSAKELLLRAGITVPLLAFLLLIQIPPTILAELWFPIHADTDANAFWPLLAWSRFLMGGGGFAIALALAIAAIGIAAGSEAAGLSQGKSEELL
ncbi:MAG: hypothetical protein WDO68_27205 [Gammaproteobacteria bacterium]